MQIQKTKSGYKQIKLGLRFLTLNIPKEWKVTKLKNFVSDIRGGAPLAPTDFAKKGFPVLHKGDIKQNDSIEISEINPYCSEKFAEKNKDSIIDESFLVVTLRDLVPSGPTIGTISHSNGKYLLAQGAYGFHYDKKNISSQYLVQLSNSGFYRKYMRSLAVGSTQIHIRTSEFFNIQLHFPDISEQKKIACILSNVDSLIESYDKVIESTKKIKTGLMQQLLTKGTGHEKFKKVKWLFGKEIEIPEEWKIKRLKEITLKIGDGIHSTPNYVDDSDYYFINGNNLINDLVGFFDNTKNVSKEEYLKYKLNLDENTVFLSINGTIGNVAYYNNEKIVLGKSVCYINCGQNLNKKFLFYILQSNYLSKFFNRELTGTTISNLSLSTVRNSPILLPKINEQEKIVTILNEIDSKIRDLESNQNHLKSIKKGLMLKLLTGQIRVKV